MLNLFQLLDIFYYKFTIKFSFYCIANFSQNCHIFIKKNFIFYHKIHKFNSYQNIFHIYSFLKRISVKSNFFIIIVTNKNLKSCLPKGNLLDATILIIFISFIEIGFLY